MRFLLICYTPIGSGGGAKGVVFGDFQVHSPTPSSPGQPWTWDEQRAQELSFQMRRRLGYCGFFYFSIILVKEMISRPPNFLKKNFSILFSFETSAGKDRNFV